MHGIQTEKKTLHITLNALLQSITSIGSSDKQFVGFQKAVEDRHKREGPRASMDFYQSGPRGHAMLRKSPPPPILSNEAVGRVERTRFLWVEMDVGRGEESVISPQEIGERYRRPGEKVQSQLAEEAAIHSETSPNSGPPKR